MAKDDPILVKEVIDRLRAAGEIDPGDLVYLDRIADRWIAIAEAHARRRATANKNCAPAQRQRAARESVNDA